MRELFEIDSDLVYLNAASLSLCPKPVLEAITRYQREFERNPTEGLRRAWDQVASAQKDLADFLGARTEDIFLRENVTAVLNLFLLGVPLPEESEMLVTEHEYGAIINICRMRAKRDDLAWRVLQLPASPPQYRGLTKEKLVDLVVSQLGPRTKLLLMSHVMSGTGLVMPLEEIAKETRRRDIYLVVDGAYAPGAIDVDFRRLENVDFYGCSLYKWMMGPKGTAFGWVSPSRQSLLSPQSAGWKTFDGSFQKTFLFSGCRDFAPYRAISDTVAFWRTVGVDAIFSRRKELRARLLTEMEEKLQWTPLHTEGPLIAYALPARLQPFGAEIVDKLLRDEGVQLGSALLRGKWYLVFSPHVHNDVADIVTCVEKIKRRTAELSP